MPAKRRPNSTPTVMLSVRIAKKTHAELAIQAGALDVPVATYVRELLESYAPGIDMKALAGRLAATPVAPLDKTA